MSHLYSHLFSGNAYQTHNCSIWKPRSLNTRPPTAPMLLLSCLTWYVVINCGPPCFLTRAMFCVLFICPTGATLQKWPHVVPSSIGAAINAKLTEIRGKKKTQKHPETLMLFDDWWPWQCMFTVLVILLLPFCMFCYFHEQSSVCYQAGIIYYSWGVIWLCHFELK